jgi:uncharacterized UPF0160 family protein
MAHIISSVLQIGIPGSIFIHANGFIGGHQTKEGALEMAIKAIAL